MDSYDDYQQMPEQGMENPSYGNDYERMPEAQDKLSIIETTKGLTGLVIAGVLVGSLCGFGVAKGVTFALGDQFPREDVIARREKEKAAEQKKDFEETTKSAQSGSEEKSDSEG